MIMNERREIAYRKRKTKYVRERVKGIKLNNHVLELSEVNLSQTFVCCIYTQGLCSSVRARDWPVTLKRGNLGTVAPAPPPTWGAAPEPRRPSEPR